MARVRSKKQVPPYNSRISKLIHHDEFASVVSVVVFECMLGMEGKLQPRSVLDARCQVPRCEFEGNLAEVVASMTDLFTRCAVPWWTCSQIRRADISII
jgi:hypothetical protein